jgi:hypothetical protein
MTTALVLLAMMVAVALVVVFVFDRKNPEHLASRSTVDPEATAEQLDGDVHRPARPGAEPMSPDRSGGDHRPPP